jgi:hypothetical protein
VKYLDWNMRSGTHDSTCDREKSETRGSLRRGDTAVQFMQKRLKSGIAPGNNARKCIRTLPSDTISSSYCTYIESKSAAVARPKDEVLTHLKQLLQRTYTSKQP